MADGPSAEQARDSVARGLTFLASRQLPSGQFPVEATLHYQPGAPVTLDASPFATTHVVYSLGHLPAADAGPLIARAVASMQREMSRYGLWRYWNRDAVWAGRQICSFIPADLDDTASHSVLLERHGVAFPDNRDLLLHNRDRRGLFYTWFVLRPRLCPAPRYWAAVLSEVTLARLTVFWRTTEAGYHDVDGVVNANVLLYLGDRLETRPVVDWLAAIIRDGDEAVCDKWYRDLFTFHYAVSRCHHAGIQGFERLRDTIHNRLAAAAAPAGQIGDSALQTALAACTLLNYRMRSPIVPRALAHLVATQHSDGSWPSAPYYYGGPRRSVSWGSAELTTALCIEAIFRGANHVGTGCE